MLPGLARRPSRHACIFSIPRDQALSPCSSSTPEGDEPRDMEDFDPSLPPFLLPFLPSSLPRPFLQPSPHHSPDTTIGQSTVLATPLAAFRLGGGRTHRHGHRHDEDGRTTVARESLPPSLPPSLYPGREGRRGGWQKGAGGRERDIGESPLGRSRRPGPLPARR